MANFKQVSWRGEIIGTIHSDTILNSEIEKMENELKRIGFKKQLKGKIQKGRYKIE